MEKAYLELGACGIVPLRVPHELQVYICKNSYNHQNCRFSYLDKHFISLFRE